MNTCVRCDGVENLYIHGFLRSGTPIYWCRKCNTERCKKYRATKKGKYNVFRAVYASISRNRVKQTAREFLNANIRKGLIVRPEFCSTCNKSCKPHGHHEDYSKPLEVIWLCRGCHADVHKSMKKT